LVTGLQTTARWRLLVAQVKKMTRVLSSYSKAPLLYHLLVVQHNSSLGGNGEQEGGVYQRCSCQ